MSALKGTPPLAFSDDDLSRAYEIWNCNCGPAALSACLGWTLEAVRPYLGDFEAKGYLNVTMMREAVKAAGFRVIGLHEIDAVRPEEDLPHHGLVRVQWEGPWTEPGANPRWAYRHTHWIAAKTWHGYAWIFDVNAGWQQSRDWDQFTVAVLTSHVKRASGSYQFTHSWEVRRSGGVLLSD